MVSLAHNVWKCVRENPHFGSFFHRMRNEVKKVILLGGEITYPIHRWIFDIRRKYKVKKGMPVRVVFLCEQPSFWPSFYSIVKAMDADSRFEVILVNQWYRKYKKDGSYVYCNSDYHDIGGNASKNFIEAYDELSHKWLNLKKLHPDYVFYMRPYDDIRNYRYRAKTVKSYARVCYVPYCIPFSNIGTEKLTPDFYFHLNFYFIETRSRIPYVRQMLNSPKNLDEKHMLCLGYPRFDSGIPYQTSVIKKDNLYSILWMPRWKTSSGNCNFFKYEKHLSKYARINSGVKLIFRPHPLCFDNFLKTGELQQTELDLLRRKYEENSSLYLDETDNYLCAFQEADVLIADPTSLIIEFFFTGKPIVFCKKRRGNYSELMEKILSCCYIVKNKTQMLSALDDLRNGIDPLKQMREELLKTDLDGAVGKSGESIKNAIIADFER